MMMKKDPALQLNPAAGPLACFLYDKMGIKKEEFLIEQGRSMQPSSPSVIMVKLELERGKIIGLIAGGRAKVMTSLAISSPSAWMV